ncbi:hypothetical protein [Methanosphaerula palustris]|uniref:Uncharacterized protein n=1 Tax=Methanosphaerula palustris (strain ATCC BAA-1556 / DSM 19958 / E1-9c) TaxID=521011 RepID=B8GI07_METPE|nr:hypothetical protein [Methanosphaerula palustris]ACL16747.1 hypothetical protein Mpal_1418 [Methanosphaerula palustris E1-9c]
MPAIGFAAGLRNVREPITAPGYGAERMIEILTEHAEHLTFTVNTLTHQVRDLEIARDAVETPAQRHPSRDVWRAAVASCDQVCLEAQEMVYDTEPADVAAGIRRVAEVLADAMEGTDAAEIMESRTRAFDATRYLQGLGPMGGDLRWLPPLFVGGMPALCM